MGRDGGIVGKAYKQRALAPSQFQGAHFQLLHGIHCKGSGISNSEIIFAIPWILHLRDYPFSIFGYLTGVFAKHQSKSVLLQECELPQVEPVDPDSTEEIRWLLAPSKGQRKL